MTTTATPLGTGAMFDAIAPRYDLINRLASLGLDRGWRRRLVAALRPPSGAPPASRPRLLVDVATGTADVALALLQDDPTVRVVGVDPSEAMLARGRAKLGPASPRATLVRGDALCLPLPSGAADGAGIAFGIRNVPDRPAAAREMARVARPGAPLAVLELAEPRDGPFALLARLHCRAVVPWLGATLSGAREYRYLATSVAAFPPPDEFAALLEGAGWRDVTVERLTFGAAHLFVGRAPGREGARASARS